MTKYETTTEETEILVLEARIDELKGIFKYIGDLNMERVGIAGIDEMTNIKEQERRWFHEAISGRIAELTAQLEALKQKARVS